MDNLVRNLAVCYYNKFRSFPSSMGFDSKSDFVKGSMYSHVAGTLVHNIVGYSEFFDLDSDVDTRKMALSNMNSNIQLFKEYFNNLSHNRAFAMHELTTESPSNPLQISDYVSRGAYVLDSGFAPEELFRSKLNIGIDSVKDEYESLKSDNDYNGFFAHLVNNYLTFPNGVIDLKGDDFISCAPRALDKIQDLKDFFVLLRTDSALAKDVFSRKDKSITASDYVRNCLESKTI